MAETTLRLLNIRKSFVFWVVMQRKVVRYRRFGTTHRYYLQGSSSPKNYHVQKTGHFSASWARKTHFTFPSHSLQIKSVILLPSPSISSKFSLSLKFSHLNSLCTSSHPHKRYVQGLVHSCWSDHSKDTVREVQFMNLFVMQLVHSVYNYHKFKR